MTKEKEDVVVDVVRLPLCFDFKKLLSHLYKIAIRVVQCQLS